MQSKELNKMVKDSKTLPLIAELHHLYGVEVIRPLGLQIVYDERNYEDKPAYYYEKIHNPNSSKWKDLEEQEQHDKEDNVTSKSELSKDCFMLGLNGVPYGAVYCTHSLISDNLLFCIRLSKDVKERGTTDTDRRTLKSFKVAQIIKGIKKRDATPRIFTPTPDNFTVLHEGLSKRDWEYQVDDVYRFNTKQMKAMFLNVIKKEPLSHEVSQELNETSLKIDKVNNAIEQLDKSFTHNILESDIHLIGASNSDSLVVIKGAFKYLEQGFQKALNNYEFIIKDQEHVKTIEDSKYFDVLASTVVMMKMAMEDRQNIHGFIPLSNQRQHFDSTLRKTLIENNGVNIIEQGTNPHFTSVWLGIPNVGEVIV